MNTSIIKKAGAFVAAFGLATTAFSGLLIAATSFEQVAEKEKPFHGKISAMDAEAKTLTVGTQTIHVTATTKITRANETIKLTDLKVGDMVHGKVTRNAEGETEAVNIKVGPNVEEKKDKEDKEDRIP